LVTNQALYQTEPHPENERLQRFLCNAKIIAEKTGLVKRFSQKSCVLQKRGDGGAFFGALEQQSALRRGERNAVGTLDFAQRV